MTGHGQSSVQHGGLTIDVEIRTVNNRFLKVVSKISEQLSALDTQLESIVREQLKRGSVTVSIRTSQIGMSGASSVNAKSLEDYLMQSKAIADKLGITLEYGIGSILLLPGVLEPSRQLDDESQLAAARLAVQSALQDLQSMRRREGEAMGIQFVTSLDQIDRQIEGIAARAPEVVSEYRTKMESRVRTSLSQLGHEVLEIDLIREVLVYADRCDVSEELTRLASHLGQFRGAMSDKESQGRRLDFLVQELFRETNTIGSKANDSRITQMVVSIKTIIEQMRELIQNVE